MQGGGNRRDRKTKQNSTISSTHCTINGWISRSTLNPAMRISSPGTHFFWETVDFSFSSFVSLFHFIPGKRRLMVGGDKTYRPRVAHCTTLSTNVRFVQQASGQ